jgi:catechol 2,3-dioxygenase-like lactoylglutathione lyase family enzyme
MAKILRVVPNLQTEQMEESRAFYTEFLGFEVGMDMGWILSLGSPDCAPAQISLLQPPTPPDLHPNLTVEVSDVVAVYEQAVAQGRDIVYPLTDEPWGVRRFFVRDPNGVIVNVMGHLSR